MLFSAVRLLDCVAGVIKEPIATTNPLLHQLIVVNPSIDYDDVYTLYSVSGYKNVLISFDGVKYLKDSASNLITADTLDGVVTLLSQHGLLTIAKSAAIKRKVPSKSARFSRTFPEFVHAWSNEVERIKNMRIGT